MQLQQLHQNELLKDAVNTELTWRCRKDEVVLCRARIGHTHLTHSYILRKDPHLRVSTVSVFRQFATFWWSAIIFIKK